MIQLESPPYRFAKMICWLIPPRLTHKARTLSFDRRRTCHDPAPILDLVYDPFANDLTSIAFTVSLPLAPKALNMTMGDIVGAKIPWIAIMSLMEQQRLIREPFWLLISKKASWTSVFIMLFDRAYFTYWSSIVTLAFAPLMYKTLSLPTLLLNRIACIAICVKLYHLVVESRRAPAGRTFRSLRGSWTAKCVTGYMLIRLVLSSTVVGVTSRVLIKWFAVCGCFIDSETNLRDPSYFDEFCRGDLSALVGMVHSAIVMSVWRGAAHFFPSYSLLSCDGNSFLYTTRVEEEIMNQQFATQDERVAWAERIFSGRRTGGLSVARKVSLGLRSALVVGVECVTWFIAISVALERQDLLVAARTKLVLDVLALSVGFVAGKLAAARVPVVILHT